MTFQILTWLLYIHVYHFDQLWKRHGVLFPKYLSKNDAIFYQMLVLKILRKEVLTTCHDTRYAAHFGVLKSLNKVKQDFHCYKMAEDVKPHVKCCSVCIGLILE